MADGKKKIKADKLFTLKLNAIDRASLDTLVEHYGYLTAAGVLKELIKRDIKRLKLQSKAKERLKELQPDAPDDISIFL